MAIKKKVASQKKVYSHRIDGMDECIALHKKTLAAVEESKEIVAHQHQQTELAIGKLSASIQKLETMVYAVPLLIRKDKQTMRDRKQIMLHFQHLGLAAEEIIKRWEEEAGDDPGDDHK